MRRVLPAVLAGFVLVAAGAGVWAQAPAGPVPAAAPAPAPVPLSPSEAADLRAFVATAPDHGLPAWPLDTLDEAGLIGAALRLAVELHGGRIDPAAVNHDWALRPAPEDPAAAFEQARAEGRLGAWLSARAPADPGYGALMAARRRYAAVQANGGWTPLAASPALKAGATDPAVAQLRERLGQEGYAAPPQGDPALFDPPLAAAVMAYQLRHGLPQDGAVGPATLAALNVPVEERLATIDANLERDRWAPAWEPTHIDVDVAGAELVYVEPGAPPLAMRIIVGDVKHHTPLFASRVDAVVFNPPWVVPTSIAKAELWPHEARSPGYLARNGFAVVNGQLRQAPGPKAALGYVKFDIDSPFGVYLHDTPSRSLFARERRALSHGCMRLQLPRDLAARVLAAQGWNRDAVEAAIAAKATRRVPVTRPVQVALAYRTAVADAEGLVTFRLDVYGWDAQLRAAVARQGGAGR